MAPYTTPFTFNVDDIFFASPDLDKSTINQVRDLNQKLKILRIW